jgi:hypothetical protein
LPSESGAIIWPTIIWTLFIRSFGLRELTTVEKIDAMFVGV